MSKAVAVTKKDEQNLALYGGLMDETPVDAKDFLIPKLLLMQSVSELVKAEKARAGEIRGSIDLNKIAEKEGSVEIIPFHVYKTWVTLAKVGNEFIEQIPLTADNCLRPKEEVRDGKDVQNYETLNYYCLLPHEIKAGMFLPYVVSFRSTSYLAGKTLETHRARLKEFGKPLPFKTFKLGTVMKKNDKNSWYVYTISESRDTTDDELEVVKKWHNIVKQGQAKVDESDLHDRTASATATDTTASTPNTVNEGDEY